MQIKSKNNFSEQAQQLKKVNLRKPKILGSQFFNRDTLKVAQELLGKILLVKVQGIWLKVRITSTEAYYLHDKASHASLGYTAKRRALFMSPGTIYMYHSRGGPSLNISTRGAGNAVLIKAGVPYFDNKSTAMIKLMQQLNPAKNSQIPRAPHKLCLGQALLCKSLGLRVQDWDQKQFDHKKFYIADVNIKPKKIIQTRRLGITLGRDEHLPYRFIDGANYENNSWI